MIERKKIMNTSDDSQNKQKQEVNFQFDGDGVKLDGDVGEAIGKGVDALKSLIGGFAQMAQDMIGPEGMKTLQAAQWLSQVAASIQQTADGLRDSDKVPLGKSGEIACFLERLEAELQGSKFETQQPSFRTRLETCSEIVERTAESDHAASSSDLKQLNDAVGYFHAAAATAVRTA